MQDGNTLLVFPEEVRQMIVSRLTSNDADSFRQVNKWARKLVECNWDVYSKRCVVFKVPAADRDRCATNFIIDICRNWDARIQFESNLCSSLSALAIWGKNFDRYLDNEERRRQTVEEWRAEMEIILAGRTLVECYEILSVRSGLLNFSYEAYEINADDLTRVLPILSKSDEVDVCRAGLITISREAAYEHLFLPKRMKLALGRDMPYIDDQFFREFGSSELEIHNPQSLTDEQLLIAVSREHTRHLQIYVLSTTVNIQPQTARICIQKVLYKSSTIDLSFHCGFAADIASELRKQIGDEIIEVVSDDPEDIMLKYIYHSNENDSTRTIYVNAYLEEDSPYYVSISNLSFHDQFD